MASQNRARRQHFARYHRILAGVLLALIVIAAGLLIAQDQATLRVQSPLRTDDTRFPQYLANLLGHRLTADDHYVVYTNGDHAFPAMLAAIEGAKERVSLETYIYESSEVGARFTNALVDAARRGVRVKMVLDAIGSKKLSREDTDRLESAGVRIGWVNPVASLKHVEEVNYRTHRKALVVDGEVAFVGGMGFADQWAHDARDFPMWRDTQVEVRGPAVTDVEAAFNQNWIVTGGIVEPEVAPDRAPAVGPSRTIVVWSSPQSGANELKLLYLLAIAAAERSIDIQSPYQIPDESSQWSLHEARKRGVRVRMLVEGDKTDAKPVKFASRGYYEDLLADGIEIAEYQPTMMHAKALVIDGVLSIVGSANFDNRSLELNDELTVAAFDKGLAARLLRDFETDLQQSKRLELDEWRSRPLTEKTRDWVWSYFGEVF